MSEQTFTFVAKSGNVALCVIKGRRGIFEAVDVTWDHSPTKKDMRECDAWWYGQRIGCGGVLSVPVEDADQRQAIIDDFLYGGSRQ